MCDIYSNNHRLPFLEKVQVFRWKDLVSPATFEIHFESDVGIIIGLSVKIVDSTILNTDGINTWFHVRQENALNGTYEQRTNRVGGHPNTSP